MEIQASDGARAPKQCQFNGSQRPEFAESIRSGQESVWDYPRPPKAEFDNRCVEVYADGVRLAKTGRAVRILETGSPPTFYIPADDVHRELLIAEPGDSVCEWKGDAGYWSLVMGNVTVRNVAWSYPRPAAGFEVIAGHLAFYPAKLECCVNGYPVTPQAGGLYGGWVTAEIVGPFKGAPGTEWW